MTVQIGRPSGHVAEVIMNRPEAMNALSTDQVLRLGKAASQLADEDQVSVVIISSALEQATPAAPQRLPETPVAVGEDHHCQSHGVP